jgi:ABC-type phosphate transport system auxiliary subunit
MTHHLNCSLKDLKKSNHSDSITIDDLSCDEKSICIMCINYLVKHYPNDMELGNEIRKIFNELKQ